jgi:predicted Zn-dependent protease with MMP-like domain
MFPQIPDEYKWIILVLLFTSMFGLFWWWNRRAKKWLEDNDRLEPEPIDALGWLLGSQQQDPKPATTLRYSEQEFREMISKVLDELPEEFDKEWQNVAVVHSTEWPTNLDKKRMGLPEGHVVFGTYSGLARTVGAQSDHSRHVIVVYQPALELLCGSDKERLEREIRRTVLHELAHHLGMSHKRMKEIGL